MIIQIGAKVWINVLQIVSVEFCSEFTRANKQNALHITMTNNKVYIVTQDPDELLDELEQFRMPTRNKK